MISTSKAGSWNSAPTGTPDFVPPPGSTRHAYPGPNPGDKTPKNRPRLPQEHQTANVTRMPNNVDGRVPGRGALVLVAPASVCPSGYVPAGFPEVAS